MIITRMRDAGSRIAIVAGVATMVAVGSVAVDSPTPAAAKPVSCAVQMNIAWGYLAIANTMYNLGYMNLYNYYYGKYEGLADAFYPC